MQKRNSGNVASSIITASHTFPVFHPLSVQIKRRATRIPLFDRFLPLVPRDGRQNSTRDSPSIKGNRIFLPRLMLVKTVLFYQ